MKLKSEINISELEKYGFTKVDKEECEIMDEYTRSCFEYEFFIDYARRGQCYYLLISEEHRELQIYASEPDGSGSFVAMPDVIITMIQDGIFEQPHSATPQP